ncbi:MULTISPECIES: DUF4174 domain-containing protein [Phaeobacter]|uniref:DUF4174 domain-containing protein n=1 Tax=Phaeobacter TaxID=302485 RepID=UPI0035A68234
MKQLFVFGKTRFWPAVPAAGAALALLLALPGPAMAQEPATTEAADGARGETATMMVEGTDPASAAQELPQTAENLAQDPITQLIRAGDSVDLDSLLWVYRPIVVFADSPADPRFHEQMERLTDGAEALLDRDVIVLTDTDPSVTSALRKTLRPRGFMLVLIGKDGGVKLRKPQPWTVRELSRTIDKFPDRLREVKERRGS